MLLWEEFLLGISCKTSSFGTVGILGMMRRPLLVQLEFLELMRLIEAEFSFDLKFKIRYSINHFDFKVAVNFTKVSIFPSDIEC